MFTVNPNDPSRFYSLENHTRITNIISKYLKSKVTEASQGVLLSQGGQENLEIEARLGEYRQKKDRRDFLPGLSPREFYRLFNLYLKESGYLYTESYSLDKSLNVLLPDNRKASLKQKIPSLESSGQSGRTFELKERLLFDNNSHYIELIDYGIRIAASREITGTLPEIMAKKNFRLASSRFPARAAASAVAIGSISESELIRLFADPTISYHRNKRRHSFTRNGVRIDMTIVDSNDFRDNEGNTEGNTEAIRTSYEIEVELIDPRQYDNFQLELHSLLKRWQDTHIVYTLTQKDLLLRNVNSLLGGSERNQKSNTVDKAILTDARNLHFADLVDGGLIGKKNEKYLEKWGKYYDRFEVRTSFEEYIVAQKADGQRKLLVIDPENGIWLIMAPGEACYLYSKERIPERFLGLHPKKATRGLTIIEGELLRRNNLVPQRALTNSVTTDTVNYFFLAYDCLAYIGDISIQKEIYIYRKAAIVNINSDDVPQPGENAFRNNLLKSDLLFVAAKKHIAFNTVEGFYNAMNNLLTEQTNGLLVYKTDGLIFTPGLVPYNPYYPTDIRPPLDREEAGVGTGLPRSLEHFPEICKWKPASRLTIDFKVRVISDGGGVSDRLAFGPLGLGEVELYSHIPKKNQLTKGQTVGEDHQLFTGSKFNRISGKQRWISPTGSSNVSGNDVLNRPLNGAIYEFAWENGHFVPKVLRSDKIHANNTDVAADNWLMIQKPIDENVLLGHSLKLSSEYHKKVKKYLYKKTQMNWKEQGFAKPGKEPVSSARGRGRGGRAPVNAPQSIEKKESVLLDIGSGYGGDLHMWKNPGNTLRFTTMILVENDREKIPELIRRLHSSEEYSIYRDRIFLVIRTDSVSPSRRAESEIRAFNLFSEEWLDRYVPVGGDDYEAIGYVVNNILKKKVDVVSLMLSMSFFWESKEKLAALARTLSTTCNSEAQIIYLTLDGDLVRGTFNPMINGFGFYRGLALDSEGRPMAAVNGRLSIYRTNAGAKANEAYMQLDLSDRKRPFLLTYLPETIVSRGDQIQKEWLPRITDLLSELPGSHLMWSYRTDKRTFLSPADKIFTNLFSYGLISYRNSSIVPVASGTGLQEELFLSTIPSLVSIDNSGNDLTLFNDYLKIGSRVGIPSVPNISLAIAPGLGKLPHSLLPPKMEKNKPKMPVTVPSATPVPPAMTSVAPTVPSVPGQFKLPILPPVIPKQVISPKQISLGKVPSVPFTLGGAVSGEAIIPPVIDNLAVAPSTIVSGKIPPSGSAGPAIPGGIFLPRIP